MKKMKAMYRKHAILARNISIAVLGRMPVPEIACWQVRSTKDPCVSGSRQSARGIKSVERVARALARGH
jgi:hypothetical protein